VVDGRGGSQCGCGEGGEDVREKIGGIKASMESMWVGWSTSTRGDSPGWSR
jgi:hypothetical protein